MATEVVEVLLLVLVAVGLVVAAGLVMWPYPEMSPDGGAGGVGTPTPAIPTSLEGVMVAKLLDHEINRRQYRQALSQLAARDDERQPLSVPEDDRPDACA